MKRININIPDELEDEINKFRGELTTPKFIKQGLEFIVSLYHQGYVVYNGELLKKAFMFEKQISQDVLAKNQRSSIKDNENNTSIEIEQQSKINNDKFLS